MKKIALVTLLFISTNLFAQEKISNPTFNGDGLYQLGNFFFDAFNSSSKNRDTAASMCVSSVTFIKFCISEKGEVVDLIFNEYSNNNLNKIYAKILESSNGKWQAAKLNGKPTKSKPIILPVFYDLHNNTNPDCKLYPDLATDFYRTFLDGLEDIGRPFQGANPFIDYNGLDCILLRPIPLRPLY